MNKKKKISKKMIIILVVIILIILAIFLKPKKEEKTKIESELIEKRDIATSISATGVITTDTTQNVVSKLTGFEIASVNVKEGDKVSVGDVICTFDTSTIQDNLATAKNSLSISQAQSNIGIQGATRSLNDAISGKNTQVSTTQAEVDSALQKYQDAQNQLNNAKNALASLEQQLASIQGTYNQKSTSYKQVQTQYNMLETAYNSASDVYKSKQALEENAKNKYNQYSSGLVPPEVEKEYKDAQTASAEALANMKNAEGQYFAYKPTYDKELSEFTPIKNSYETLSSSVATSRGTVSQLEATVGTLKSTYDNLVNALNSTVSTSDSTIASMQDALTNTELSASLNTQTQNSQIKALQDQVNDGILKSTVNGTVTSVNAKPGELYTGSTIAVIDGVEVFVIEAEIDEYDIADVEVGMKVLIKTDATRDEELEGRIIYTAPSATTSVASMMGTATTTPVSTGSATYKVKIALDEQNERLRLGMNARLSIITDSKEDVWSVPSDAIHEKEDGTKYIEILKNEETEEKEELPVTTGIEGSYYIQIMSDKLKDGMKVVLPVGNSTDSIEALIEMMGPNAGV